MMHQISICEFLSKRYQIDPFLKRMVTGDEKLVTYDNIMRKRSWSKCGKESQMVVKPGLRVRKALLSIWWDWKEITYYELLPLGQGLNSDLYCNQLDHFKKRLTRNGQIWPTEEVSCSIRTTPGNTLL
ncbi:mariner transposase [Trichonephila clavipes]|nr:mariner transposase [Trichonephila clavipes]